MQKLSGSTLQPLIDSQDLEDVRFQSENMFVTKEETVYLSDNQRGRILRFRPGEARPVVVGEVPGEEELWGLFVTEEEKIYVADNGSGKVWAFNPGDTTRIEVLSSPDDLLNTVLVQDGSLFVGTGGGIYEYALPPELQLKFIPEP